MFLQNSFRITNLQYTVNIILKKNLKQWKRQKKMTKHLS